MPRLHYSKLTASLGLALFLSALLTPARADILTQTVARVPARPQKLSEVGALLQGLAQNPRCTLQTIGWSWERRPLWMAQVTDPTSPYQKATLFVMARQHGNEAAGTSAILALLEQLVTAPTPLEQEILKYLRVVAVPVVNPDGAAAGRRTNAHGQDLNRDWGDLTQPETQAVDRAVRQIQPHAILDLHELPAESDKPAYQTNFIETSGPSSRLPSGLVLRTKQVSSRLVTWMHTLGYPVNVYYDYPGQDSALAHRYFGLYQQFPTFLLEAKTGGGRTLADRAGYHLVGCLVVANYIMHDLYDTPQEASPAQPGAGVNTPAPQQQVQGPALPAPPPAAPLAVKVSFKPATEPSLRGEICAVIEGGEGFQYVTCSIGGHVRALSNLRSNYFALDLTGMPAGEHQVRVAVYNAGDAELAAEEITLRLTGQSLVEAR